MPPQKNVPVDIHINTGNNKINAQDANTTGTKKDAETQTGDEELQRLLSLENKLKKAEKDRNTNIETIKKKKSDRRDFLSAIPLFFVLTATCSYLTYIIIAAMVVPFVAIGGEFILAVALMVVCAGAFAALALLGPSLAIKEIPEFIEKGKEIKEMEVENVQLDALIPELESSIDDIRSQIEGEQKIEEGREVQVTGNYISSEEVEKSKTESQTRSDGVQYIEVETKDPPSSSIRNSDATQTTIYSKIDHDQKV